MMQEDEIGVQIHRLSDTSLFSEIEFRAAAEVIQDVCGMLKLKLKNLGLKRLQYRFAGSSVRQDRKDADSYSHDSLCPGLNVCC